jgi:very-short-patch-repair endonuclease
MHRRSSLIALRALQLRSSLTPTEQLLWSRINACQLGVWFGRQAFIAGFIVDFVAPSARLIAGVDGAYHSTRHNADKRRDRTIRRPPHQLRSHRSNIQAALTPIHAAQHS